MALKEKAPVFHTEITIAKSLLGDKSPWISFQFFTSAQALTAFVLVKALENKDKAPLHNGRLVC